MDELNKAIGLYVGWGIDPYPKEDETRVLDYFGSEKGRDLSQEVKVILTRLQNIKPDWNRHDLAGAGSWAADEVARSLNTLNEEGKAALAWIYTWWWK
ncbi:hypothetical protein [Sphingosinicella sp.]|uniref:hypothetical protein n=1 Tax=Sphingosinicella sp. TaxID=1917971 RepID=UPI00403838ED